MKKQIIAFPVQRRKNNPDPFRAGLEMPLDSELLEVAPFNQGLAVITLADTMTPVIWHPILVMPVMVGFEQTIGREIGHYIGHGVIEGSAVFLFEDWPWPRTILEAAEMQGTA